MKKKRQTVTHKVSCVYYNKHSIIIQELQSIITTLRIYCGSIASIIVFIGNKLVEFPQDNFISVTLTGNKFLDYSRIALLGFLICFYVYFLNKLRKKNKQQKTLYKEVLNHE